MNGEPNCWEKSPSVPMKVAPAQFEIVQRACSAPGRLHVFDVGLHPILMLSCRFPRFPQPVPRVYSGGIYRGHDSSSTQLENGGSRGREPTESYFS